METKRKYLTTEEVLDLFEKKGLTAQDFLEAVKTWQIKPCWSDGSPMNREEIDTAMAAIEEAAKTTTH